MDTLFSTPDQTEVPALRDHLATMAAEASQRKVQQCEKRVKNILISLLLLCRDENDSEVDNMCVMSMNEKLDAFQRVSHEL